LLIVPSLSEAFAVSETTPGTSYVAPFEGLVRVTSGATLRGSAKLTAVPIMIATNVMTMNEEDFASDRRRPPVRYSDAPGFLRFFMVSKVLSVMCREVFDKRYSPVVKR